MMFIKKIIQKIKLMTIDEEEQLEMPDGEFNTFMRDIF